MAPQASPSLHLCWHVCLLAVALARQCQAIAGSEPRATRSETAFAGAEMYTEAKNLLVNSPGGAVILNGVGVGDIVRPPRPGRAQLRCMRTVLGPVCPRTLATAAQEQYE